jgi:predicted 3-demethylubiquinone-9 3-methyltransferase (glyoxalase superfamily)
MQNQKVTTFLWYDDQAEEAARFYTSLFKNSKIADVARYSEAGPGKPRTVMTVVFELAGQKFIALNGGPEFKFTEAISLMVDCDDQEEVDQLWEKLTADRGQEQSCGWLKDKYGPSWQIIPRGLLELVGGPGPEKSSRAMEAMFKMKKIDLEAIRRAYEGK